MAFLKWGFVIIFGIFATYYVHIPALKYFTAPKAGSSLMTYAPLAKSIENDAFVLERVFAGSAAHIIFDPDRKEYLIVGHLLVQPDDGFSDWHLMVLSESGEVLEVKGITADFATSLIQNTRYEYVTPNGEPYQYAYDFSNHEPAIELAHFAFETLERGPYLYYFIPVVETSWAGTAFVKILHEGARFLIRVATDFDGGMLYSQRNIDGQLYYHKRAGETMGVAFLEVGESSYTRDMNGVESHREGYGIYVIRPK